MDEKFPNSPDYSRLLHDQQERLKELACINTTTSILREGKTVEESLNKIVKILPAAWQYPEYTVARISYMGMRFESARYSNTDWKMVQDFNTIDGEKGIIEVCYTTKFRDEKEGPFLKEERDLIQNIANIITGYINSYRAREVISPKHEESDKEDALGRKLMQKFLDRHNYDRDIFHDLMPFKVKEILLVANLYDAYSIESEGRFTELMLGEYYQLNLSSVPRLTGVSSEDEAFAKLNSRHYDLIIIMVGVEKNTPLSMCRKLKEKYPYIPLYLLLNNPADAPYISRQKKLGVPFDNHFVWTGDSKIFSAMVNLLEDSVNAENDTRKGPIMVILLVENSSRFYSSYLPMLYSLIFEQTRNLFEDVSSDGLYKMLKLKGRPKIMLATSYEDAISIFEKYHENLFCLISDMRFPKDGAIYGKAGYELVQHVKQKLPNLPTVLQSSDTENSKYAHQLKAIFINKNSETLLQDLKSFINYYLGFGSFIYRDKKGGQIAEAKSIKEFEEFLQTVPEDSLVYHSRRNHFSLWLMARGEVKIAKMIAPIAVADFKNPADLRDFLLSIIRQRRREMNRGKVVNFDKAAFSDESNVVSLASGSLGGKGRGLAFINSLIYSFEIGRLQPGINIRTPMTAIIGTDEFDQFMEHNHLWTKVKENLEFSELQKLFLEGSLSYTLEKRLRVLIKILNKPLAVRSSSLFEDSTIQPFSGIFGTYLLPNNDPDPEIRSRQLSQAIKLVFSSVYSPDARSYFSAIGYKIEQEKMAVVIQSVVGNRFEDVFYPHISGTAQSFNFYPVSHMTPEDGVAIAAVGLGQYVVDGGNAFRFSPGYPSIDVVSQKDLFRNSQVQFYAIDMSRPNPDLLQGEKAGLTMLSISEAERHGTLNHSASVLNPDNDSITAGLDKQGSRIINFADILKYNYIPLASTIKIILDVVKEAIGSPVEIEYAVDLKKDESGSASFYLLQIKPIAVIGAGYSIDIDSINKDELLLLSGKSMGNGKLEYITDIIYAEPQKLGSAISSDMAAEIAILNGEMSRLNRKYVLIGPGRWGTRDPSLGIPVTWPAISGAKVIVEVNLPGIHLDASLGSHFFHNVTSMNVGYFSINTELSNNLIRWDKLNNLKKTKKGKYFNHIIFDKPLTILMDGRKGIALITINK
jgi:DNA-binding NarL/FixJ family response regulator